MLKSASLAAKVLLALAAFAALAYWGAATGHGAWAAAGAVTLCCSSGRGDSAGFFDKAFEIRLRSDEVSAIMVAQA